MGRAVSIEMDFGGSEFLRSLKRIRMLGRSHISIKPFCKVDGLLGLPESNLSSDDRTGWHLLI
jgi:hypothetical protein